MARNGGPWFCMGDLNEMNSITKKDGSRPISPIRLTFRKFLNSTSFMDLDSKGCKFTSISNPRHGVITKQKVDRIIVNWGW